MAMQLARQVPWKEIWPVLLVRLILSLALLMYRSNYVMLLQDEFDLSPSQIGYVVSLCAGAGMVGALAVPALEWLVGSRRGDRAGIKNTGAGSVATSSVRVYLLVNCLAVASMVGISRAGSTLTLIGWATAMTANVNVARAIGLTLILTQCSGATAKRDVGLITGVADSVLAVSRLSAPVLAGAITQALGHRSLVLVCAGIGACGTLVASLTFKREGSEESG